MPTKTILDYSGVLVRVMTTIQGYYETHEEWPAVLAVYPEAAAALMTKHLTPDGLLRLQRRLRIEVGNDAEIAVSSTSGVRYRYGDSDLRGGVEPVVAWLGLELPPDDWT